MADRTNAILTRYRGQFEKYTKGMHTRMSVVWSKAVLAYIEAAVTDEHIHVDTGMSAASTLPMLGKLKNIKTQSFRTRMTSNINSRLGENREGPAISSAKGSYSPSGVWNPSATRSFTAGLQQGQQGTRVLYGSQKRARFVFEFNIQPWQWQKQESSSWGAREGNWQALAAGEVAFNQYIQDHIEEAVAPELLAEALQPIFS